MIELPQDWTECKLGEICYPSQYGWTSSAAEIGENFRFLRTTDISKGNISWSSVPFCEQAPEEPERYLLKPNDIVISRAGSIGLSTLIGECPPSLFASYLIRFRPLEQFSAKYLAFYLQSPHYWQQVRASAVGIALQNINATKLSRIEVPIAPRSEQDRIVAEIEKQFTRLDDAVAALKRVQINLKRYRTSVLKAACEGRLVPTEAELARKEGRSYEPASELLKRILAERRAKWEADYLQKMIAAGKPPRNEEWKKRYNKPNESGTSNLKEVPEGWIWTNVGQLFDCIVPNRDKPKSFSGDIPWITLPDFGEQIEISESLSGLGLTPDEVANSRARVVPPRSVVMTCIGRFGIAAVLAKACVINQQLHAFLIPDWLPARYFAYALQNQRSYMESISTSTTIAYLNKDNCNSVPIPLPPANEQIRITERLDQLFSGIAALEKDVKQKLRHATAMRNAILACAFSGKLVPQDPNDEPASMLLERIRAERAALAANNGSQKATPETGANNGQRRRRVTRLAHRVSGGKGVEK
jgi:type I restriction enzyme, S subunit